MSKQGALGWQWREDFSSLKNAFVTWCYPDVSAEVWKLQIQPVKVKVLHYAELVEKEAGEARERESGQQVRDATTAASARTPLSPCLCLRPSPHPRVSESQVSRMGGWQREVSHTLCIRQPAATHGTGSNPIFHEVGPFIIILGQTIELLK